MGRESRADCEVSRGARSSLVLSAWVGMEVRWEVGDRHCVIWFRCREVVFDYCGVVVFVLLFIIRVLLSIIRV